MASLVALRFILVLVALLCGAAGEEDNHYHHEHDEEFILDTSIAKLLTSSAGEIRQIVGSADENRPLWEHDVALGYINMEPKALLLPQYMDAASVFFVQQGEALVKWIRRGSVASKNIKAGDVFSMPAGAVFYLLSTGESQESVRILGMMDTSNSYKRGRPQHFFVAGGIKPNVVFAGFDLDTLAAAFKVSREELVHFLSSQRQGPIIYTTVQLPGESRRQEKSEEEELEEKPQEKTEEVQPEEKHEEGSKSEEHGEESEKKQDEESENESSSHDAGDFNLFERPMFENSYGWASAATRSSMRFEVSAVHLKPASMLAPHWNSRGCVFGVVTKGSGTMQIAYANGTKAAEETLKTGSVFYVPQLLPASHIAAADSPLEFVSFTVVSRGMEASNELHFLAGYNSVLQKIDLSIVALSLNVPEQLVRSFLNAQQEEMILPATVQRGFEDH